VATAMSTRGGRIVSARAATAATSEMAGRPHRRVREWAAVHGPQRACPAGARRRTRPGAEASRQRSRGGVRRLHEYRVSDNPSDFGYPRVSVSGMDFHPNWFSGRIRVLDSGFGFGCPDTPPDPNPPRCHSYPSPHHTSSHVRSAREQSTGVRCTQQWHFSTGAKFMSGLVICACPCARVLVRALSWKWINVDEARIR
jgi:hypothetical protein